MYAVTEGLAKVNGKTVETFEREISEGRVALQVEAGTTGYTGDSTREAGGRTLLCFTCICGMPSPRSPPSVTPMRPAKP